jgi:ABC-2 type transport system permease protein
MKLEKKGSKPKAAVASADVSPDVMEAREMKSRKLKYGILATVYTVVFIIAVVVVNIFIGYLTDRYVLEFDMTSEDLYEISEDTKEVLADLDEQVTITVLAEESDSKDTLLLAKIHEVLQRYEALAGGKIKLEFINPTLNPQLLEKYSSLGKPSHGDIIIESSKRFKHLTPSNLYEYKSDKETGEKYIVGLRAEQRLTSGILFVLADSIPSALYTTGHGEIANLTRLDGLLTSGNYEVGTINLALEDIPEETTILIISSPTADFTDEEIEKMDAFFARGGNAIITMTYTVTEPLERLERYFEEWGIRYDTSMVMDRKQSLSGYPMYVVPTIHDVEGLTETLDTKSSFILVPGARPIELLFSESGWRANKVLFSSSSAAYSKSFEKGIVSAIEQEEGDKLGPFNVGVLSVETHMDNLDYDYSFLLFLNTGMISDSVLETDNMLNSKYMMAAIDMMTDDSDAVIIQPKNFSSITLTVLGSQVRALFWILIIVIPFGILAVGIAIWLRRRHL